MVVELMNNLQSANLEAAKALQAGARMADRAMARTRGGEMPGLPSGDALGALIGSPVAFWATAAVDGRCGGDVVAAIAEANRLAAARLAVGDMGHIRDGLLGQAVWLGIQAVKYATLAESFEKKPERAIAYSKLALMAQRQAAQTLASAAALNKLGEAGVLSVEMVV